MRDIYILKNNFMDYNHVKSVPVIKGNVEDPDFSIFIPTYKRTETLKVSIESAINQVGDINYEIVIVNNDPDGAKGYARELIEGMHNDRIYYYVNEENIGLCGNWNRGIELSRGEYVSMIHDDDMLSPWFLSSILTAIKQNDSPDIVGVSYIKFNSNEMPDFQRPEKLAYRKVTKKSFFFGRYINVAGMTVNREAIMELGGYANEHYPNEDSILIYQALLHGRVVNIESVLAGYRQEVNLSLNDDMMKKIILVTEKTRRFIAEHERFARNWMRIFDREYLYKYISDANRYWNLDVDHKDILEEANLSTQPINKVKYNIMKTLLKIERRWKN